MARSRPSRFALPVLALSLVCGAAAIWWALEAPRAPSAVADAPRAANERSATEQVAAPIAPAAEPAAQPRADEPADEADERDTVATSGEDELASAQWVSGSVLLPEGLPLGEKIEVIAQGRAFKHRDYHRAALAADGTFRVAFSKNTVYGWLKIDAPHLYLDSPPRLKIAALPERIVLEPRLGGCIVGTIVAPPGEDDSVLDGKSVGLHGWSEATHESIQRSGKIEGRSKFELHGIPANLGCQVQCDLGVWPELHQLNVSLSAGETRELELRFERGVRVSGRILGEDGSAIADVEVRAEFQQRSGNSSWSSSRSGKVEADGSFSVRGIAAGKVTVVASKKGLAEASLELGELADGEAREGVELRLGSGHFLAGRVSWPDGRPAVGGRVMIDEHSDRSELVVFGSSDHTLKLEPDGTFRVTGLRQGPFVVTATANAEIDPSAVEAGAKRKKGALAVAKLEDVAADRADLVLVLQTGGSISGRVVDDLGAPLKRFWMRAQHADEEDSFSPAAGNAVTSTFTPDDGTFVLEGLRDGEWRITLRANGYWQSDPVSIQVPLAESLELVVARAAKLRGTVLDPDGKPLAKATVRAQRARERRFVFGWDESEPSDTTDSKGRFEMKNAPTEKIELIASHTDFASSEAMALAPTAGQVLEDLTLQLRRGARLTGELHASAGNVVGRSVNVQSEGGGTYRNATTDSNGRFEFTGLDPGDYQVSAEPSEAELKELGDGDDQKQWIVHSSLRKSARVKLVDGETKHVVLGAPPRAPVQVSGRVRRGSAGVAGAIVQAYTMDGSNSGQKAGTCDAEGRYELTVDQPGKYHFTVHLSDSGTQTSRQEDVPEAASFTLDFELEGGRIAGRVLGPEGEALEGITVQLEPARATAERRSSGTHGWMQTEADGSFSFDYLPSGTYAVSASEMRWTNGRPSQRYGTARRGGIELGENGKVEGLELKLAIGGTLEGTVRDSSGAPAVGARVHLRDENGELARNLWNLTTDGTGHFRASGLAPGRWSAVARLDDECSEASAPVAVDSGESESVDLVLRRGTYVRVNVQDSEGKRVGSSLSVRDERGSEFADFPSFGRPSANSPPPGIGPLPPGTYTITATNHDGATGSTKLTVRGEAEAEATVTMKTQ